MTCCFSWEDDLDKTPQATAQHVKVHKQNIDLQHMLMDDKLSWENRSQHEMKDGFVYNACHFCHLKIQEIWLWKAPGRCNYSCRHLYCICLTNCDIVWISTFLTHPHKMLLFQKQLAHQLFQKVLYELHLFLLNCCYWLFLTSLLNLINLTPDFTMAESHAFYFNYSTFWSKYV